MIIYKITNKINNKVYIGLTTTTLQQRWSTHKRYAIGKYKSHPLYNAMNKYGVDNFDICKIDETEDINELGKLERFYISKYNSQNKAYGYNITAGGEHNQLDANPRAKLTVEDVINIRQMYKDSILSVKQIWEFYKNKISYSAFEKIYEGYTWKSIMPEVYTEDIKQLHSKFKIHVGITNGNGKFTDNEVLEIRKYYQTHTLKETYEKYNKNNTCASFRSVINKCYKHLPIYNKSKNIWLYNNTEININDYNPVSTISVSGE